MPRRRPTTDKIAVIDLFAGPGGLGEGFSSYERNGHFPFDIVLSAEKDPMAQRTLELRSFYRKFRGRALPREYWAHLKGEVTRGELFAAYPQEGREAQQESELFELSEENRPRLEKRLNALGLDRDRTIVIGGPPCQAYSVAGRSRNGAKKDWTLETDARSHLYREYLHVLAHVQPAAFVMENVRGLLSAKFDGASVFEMIRADLHQPSVALERGRKGRRYRLFPVTAVDPGSQASLLPNDDLPAEAFLVRAEEHGIPQARQRVIILGIAEELVPSNRPRALAKAANQTTVKDAIGKLPPVRSVLSAGTDSHPRWLKALRGALAKTTVKGIEAAVLAVMEEAVDSAAAASDMSRGAEWLPGRGRRGPVLNHEARGHMEKDLHRYLFASAWAQVNGISPTLEDFPIALLPDHANIGRSGGGTIFNDRFRVQLWDSPSTTVVSHISKDGHYYIHPDPSQCRSLTVREAARLQTFPDDYFFCGPRTAQYHQVGNAVPVVLAGEIARMVSRLVR